MWVYLALPLLPYFLTCLFVCLVVGDKVGSVIYISWEKKTADSSGKLFLSRPLYYPTCSSWKSVCETEGESCVCPLKLMACAVGKWMICTFRDRCSHNENLSEQITPNSHAPSVQRLACDTREETMCRFQPLPTACDSHTLEFLPHWKMVLCLLLPTHCCIALAMLWCNWYHSMSPCLWSLLCFARVPGAVWMLWPTHLWGLNLCHTKRFSGMLTHYLLQSSSNEFIWLKVP